MSEIDDKCDLTELRRLVPETLQGADGWAALRVLEEQNEILRKLWGDDPMGAVTADLFLTADELAVFGLQLAKEFAKRSKGEYEEHAWRLRSKSICTARSYDRHLVGPAMLDWADCSLKLGKQEIADTIYNAIIQDFTELLRREPSANPECRIGLQSLERALVAHSTSHDELLGKTRATLKAILS